ncbi:lipase family protein [Pelosinus sp. UFO1]|uniref:lipase family protein n=1 Tax=Pelosinus sp. UFO1 TaxID=484770 RepID=UPI0004D13CAF|nr:lipase family protein [Pelosinus sp. UFO1]AIF52756.1 lipase class 3 [Pelosinus sp. UFO1]
MKKILKCIYVISFIFLLLQPVLVSAIYLEEYEEARTLYMAAAACTAVYSDRVGIIARDALVQDGWKIQYYVGKDKKADARFLFAKKSQEGSSIPLYLLSAVGTENIKDVKTDLRVGKVYFAGKGPEEFSENAQRKNMPDTVPKVHEGFNQYVQAGFSKEIVEEVGNSKKPFLDILQEDGDKKVYLVGHSLGGAGVTIGGARLLEMGIKPEQVEVITFGAPAVGNHAFRQKYEPLLHLTRVVATGDPVTQALQKLVGGYEQFGREIRWQVPTLENPGPHQITLYLDLAIKNYYQKRLQAVQAGELSMPKQSFSTSETSRVFVAPLKNDLPEELQAEFVYMKEALQDEYRATFSNYMLAGEETNEDIFQKALAEKSEWVVVPTVQAHKVKDEENVYYITLTQRVYRVENRAVVHAASYGSSTREMTPLEAFIHDMKTMSHDRQEWLGSDKGK